MGLIDKLLGGRKRRRKTAKKSVKRRRKTAKKSVKRRRKRGRKRRR